MLKTLQDSASLQRFIETLPARPYWSHSKRLEKDFIASAERAVSRPYIQLNTPWLAHHVRFDIDRDGSAFDWEAEGLPAPSHIVINPANGHSTYIYTLASPVPKNMSQKTKKLLADITGEYKTRLDADAVTIFQRQLVKNPYYHEWRAIHNDREYTLTELAEYLTHGKHKAPTTKGKGQAYRKPKKIGDVLDPSSRNRTLFDAMRHYAYGVVNDCGDRTELFALVHAHGLDQQGDLEQFFSVRVSNREIQHIVRSVANWTWDNRGRFMPKPPRRAGVMKLPPKKFLPRRAWKAEIKRRQGLGARHTHERRREDTKYRIMEAIGKCLDNGHKPTKTRIAQMTGIARRTVIRHRDLFEGCDIWS